MSEDLYEPPRAELSQGDIFELLPGAHISYPMTALFAGPSAGLYQAELHPYRDQFDDKNGTPVMASCKRTRAMLLTYDCEIDKPQIKNWTAAPVVPISFIPGPSHADIRKNKVFSLLHLPKHRDKLDESVLVLNHLTTLGKDFFGRASRVVSLSDLGRKALYLQYIRWLTRWQLSDMRCPNCAITFNASDGMIVRAP